MSSTNTNPTIVLDTGSSLGVFAVAFHPDGMHLLGRSGGEVGRWRLSDGQKVGNQTGMQLRAIATSRDHKWVVCGTWEGASVWDAELRKKAVDVENITTVRAVDVSPDSTRFATGTGSGEASVWSISSGKRLVGPLKHEGDVMGVKFSPNGEQIATACPNSICVFDSYNGHKLITMMTITPGNIPTTPLSWSKDGQQIFAVAEHNKIRAFRMPTGSQLAETEILADDRVESIALATNGKFFATYARQAISFLDTSTLTRIGPVIKDSGTIYSIALSLDSRYLATGRGDGKITVRDIGHILPESYGPFSTSTPEERQPDQQPSTSDSHNHEQSDSTVEQPGKSSQVESVDHNEESDGDLLEVEPVPSNSPALEFDYDESLSPASSVHLHEEDTAPPGMSNAVPQSLDALPTSSPVDIPLEENVNTAKSSQGISMLKRLFPTRIRKSNKDSASHKPDRVPRKSRQAPNDQSRSHSPARMEDSNVGPSTMTAARPKRRVVATSFRVPEPKRKSRTKPSQSKKARSGQGVAGAVEAGAAQQVNNPPHPSAGRIYVTDQRESGDATISLRLPAWMLCRGSTNEDGTHG